MEPTEAGTVVVERAREIVGGADAIRSDLARLRGLLEGTVALGTMLPPGPIALPGLLARFRAAHPGIGVHVREGSALEILAAVRRDELDVAFTGVEPEALDGGLAGERMLSDELLLIAPPDHRPLKLDQLDGVPFIGCRRGSALRDTVDGALRAAATTPELVFESDELVSVRELWRAGSASRSCRARRSRATPARPGRRHRPRAAPHAGVARPPPAPGRRGLRELRPRRDRGVIEIRRFGADDAALLRNVRLRALREAPEAFATRYEEASAQLPDYWTEMASESKTPRCRSWRWTASWASASSRAGCSTAATPGWPVCGWRPRRAAPALELSVTATDPTAAALYARAGFAETGRRRPLPADPSRTEIFLSRRL